MAQSSAAERPTSSTKSDLGLGPMDQNPALERQISLIR